MHRYIPLEVLNGQQTDLPKADMFMLGITLYELTTCMDLPTGGCLLVALVFIIFVLCAYGIIHDNLQHVPSKSAHCNNFACMPSADDTVHDMLQDDAPESAECKLSGCAIICSAWTAVICALTHTLPAYMQVGRPIRT